jgi:DNA (cytosine-5)-methyltransferase 1
MTKPNADIRAVDLFCGVGGLTHGLISGGIRVKAGYDLDPACHYPYEKNNHAKFFERDVTDLTAEEISPFLKGGDFSLLAGCAPCQPFSSYSQGGRSKKRVDDWQLVASYGRLVREIQPDFVTMENVVQLSDHPVFQQFLTSLKGYFICWSVIELAELGVPQSRRRLVLLASKHSDMGLQIRPESGTEKRTVRQTISKLPPILAGEAHEKDALHVACSLSELNMSRIRASTPGGTWRDWDPSLQAECHKKGSGATYPSVYGRMEWDQIAPTITTQCFGYGNGRFGHPEQDRAISLREAAMLQTFPHGYVFVEPGAPIRFNKLGRLIGNAVPVRLGRVIAETFFAHAEMLRASDR